MINIIKKLALQSPQIKRLVTERDTLKVEKHSLEAKRNALIIERDALKAYRERLERGKGCRG